MSLLQQLREWVDGLFGEDVATDDVGEEYLRERARFGNIETSPDEYPDQFRCNLCGRLFDSMDECVTHVAAHDGQGDASVDPFSKNMAGQKDEVRRR